MRDSLIEALAQGIGVTAKVSWLTRVSRPSTCLEVPHLPDDASITTTDEVIEGKARWIHCTPLTGSDGNVGVIMVIMVDKQDAMHSLPDLSSLSSMRSSGHRMIGPVPPCARERAKSHTSFRSEHTPERWTPREHRSSRSSVIKERPSMDESRKSMETSVTPPARGGTINNPPTRSMGGSRLYADWMKEIREAQKRVDSSSARLREHEVHDVGLGGMARAVEVKVVNGRGRTKKVGGTL